MLNFGHSVTNPQNNFVPNSKKAWPKSPLFKGFDGKNLLFYCTLSNSYAIKHKISVQNCNKWQNTYSIRQTIQLFEPPK
ncbi:MAG: hypothetical protein CMH48_11100 [Muricauda sp.]|uniref:Uncharacterized protein n=1 Tax=Flagellimonas lutaonensis TaxID=516051 RepID=A0A0D5YQ59_9FLAO|nr:hypothetical protein VC82_324 [Allomuricauda lutaonensis]MAU26570.1 hypothetical protein [Allomuricauda sp.]MBC31379.1 hypothetical protein [Allomuricauda sp.]